MLRNKKKDPCSTTFGIDPIYAAQVVKLIWQSTANCMKKSVLNEKSFR
jgi:hypothetical protein